VIDANMLVLDSDKGNFRAFNVGSGKQTTVLEYASEVLAKIRSGVELQISGEYRRGDNRHSVSSIESLSQIGWKPRHDLSKIMDDFLEWIESVGGVPEEVTDAYGEMRRAGVVLTSSC
jgi:dTDP-L-rhamnose 4-epimerase